MAGTGAQDMSTAATNAPRQRAAGLDTASPQVGMFAPPDLLDWDPARIRAFLDQIAAAATGYILAGIWFEERDLVRSLGPAYASYLASVPALIPGLRPRVGRR